MLSVWPPDTTCRTFFSAVTWAIAWAMPEFTSPMMNDDLVALDQLARLLHAGADVVCGILHQELDRAPQHAALGVDLLDGKLCADQFVLRHGGINPRERIYHADADRRFAARRDDERRRDLKGTGCGGAFEHGATIE